MKLSLTHKGVLLVVVLLLFQFLFVGVLALLLTQAEQESSCIFHSANIGNCSNKLIKDVFEMSAISHSELLDLISSNAYKDKIAVIRGDLNDLSKAAKDDPAQQLVVKKSAQAGEEAFMLIEQLRSMFTSGDVLTAIDQLKQLRGELRSCMQRMISKDLLTMAQVEKEKAEQAHSKQLAFRRQIKLFLIVGLVINAALTIFVALIFAKKIMRRLAILADNNYRLASKMPLNPLMGGTDEIAELDSTFHEMAISLSEAKQKEKSMIEYSLDAICSLDVNGKITAANPACTRILGYPNDLILGNNLRNILINGDIECFSKSLSLAQSGKTKIKFESQIKQQDGKLADVLWSINWVESEQSFFCVGHDITERKEVERLKQQFMAMVSHDLRTPLSTIANYLEMLAAGLFGELSEKGNHLLHVAETNTNRMLALINDLLDLERAEFGGLKIDCIPRLLGDLLNQSIRSVSSLAQKKHIQLEFSQTDLIVIADGHRILQVLANLLSNAIKFSPEHGIVKIEVEEHNDQAVIHIVDQGRGVPEEMKEKIFEHFQQVDVTDTTDKGGSGLGLAICKNIIELHDGRIKVENNPNVGCTFSFSLPLVRKTSVQAA